MFTARASGDVLVQRQEGTFEDGSAYLTGGLTRSGSHRVKVSRRAPTSGPVQILQEDLQAIEKGHEPDLVLLPDDQIEVKARLL